MVYVDLVGRTDRRWISHQDGIPANLANTGLNVHTERAVLTSAHYGTANINVAARLGSFGWLFFDRHGSEWVPAQRDAAGNIVEGTGMWGARGDLIAFRAESTYVTGFVNAAGTVFNVAGGQGLAIGSPNLAITPRLFWNGVQDQTISASTSAAGMIRNIAGDPAPDHDTDARQVTMAVSISGSTITRIHSILGWQACDARVVIASDLARIERDNVLLTGNFPLNLNQEIDYKQFQLIGVDCLLDIEPEHVVFVYRDGGDVIRRVAVGTEVVEGTMTETNFNRIIVDGRSINYSSDRLTSLTRPRATAPADVVEYAGSDVRVLLDAYGHAFRIDILDQEVGNFAMVLLATTSADPRGEGMRLYTNDDEESFFNVNVRNHTLFNPRPFLGNQNPNRRNSTFENNAGFAPGTNPAVIAGDAARMIGFGLNTAGAINVIENAVDATSIQFRSSSVVRVVTPAIGANPPTAAFPAQDARDLAIDANAPIFHFDGEWQVASIGDVDLSWFRTNSVPGQYILNTAGTRVIAIAFGDASDFIDPSGDGVFALLNNWGNLGGGASNLHGFFDGSTTATVQRTADDTNFTLDRSVPAFWLFGTNAAGAINTTGDNLIVTDPDLRFVSGSPANPAWAGRVQRSIMPHDAVQLLGVESLVGWVDFSRNALMVADDLWITYYDDVVVYRATRPGGNMTYAASDLGSITPNAWVWAFNTAPSTSDITGAAHVVIWMSNADFPAGWPAVDAGITTQPADVTISLATTTSATFNAVVVGNPAPTIQWFEFGVGPLANVAGSVAGVNTQTLVLSGLAAGDDGRQFYFTVDDGVNPIITSNTVTLHVNP